MKNLSFPKIGLVTGCGKGIGLSITKKLLLNGNDIVIGISRSINKEIQHLIEENKERFIFHECNITNIERITKIIKDLKIKFKKIDYAICNAGVRSRLSIKNCDLDIYRNILENNTISNINITRF